VNVLLVPAHPGFPGQIPQSRKTVVCVVCIYRCMLWWMLCLILVLTSYSMVLSTLYRDNLGQQQKWSKFMDSFFVRFYLNLHWRSIRHSSVVMLFVLERAHTEYLPQIPAFDTVFIVRQMQENIHTYIRLMAFFPGQPG